MEASLSGRTRTRPTGRRRTTRVLDDITLYWLTNTGTSAGRIYWENGGGNPNSAAAQKTSEISVPVAITVFPGESYQAPRSWAERAYPNLNSYNQVDKGGHFAAWEQPELFAVEIRGIQIAPLGRSDRQSPGLTGVPRPERLQGNPRWSQTRKSPQTRPLRVADGSVHGRSRR
jgi:hypothetical protein